MKKNDSELNQYLNNSFVNIYGNTLEQLDKEDLIKIIAIMHNVNMRIGTTILNFQKCETSKSAEDVIYDIADEMKYSNIPFYNKAEDLKEDINNRYNR